MTQLVVNPATGEALDLAALDDEGLVQRIHEVRRLQQLLRELTDELSGEVLRRMDMDARYSGQVGEFVVRGDGPGQVEYDPDGLRKALRPFVIDGVISQAAVDSAVAEKTVLKVNANGVKALLKRGDDVSAAVEACGQPKKRRVTVKDADA